MKPIPQIPVTEEDIALAKTWCTAFNNQYSIRNDDGKFISANLGEIIFQRTHPKTKRISDNDRAADFEGGKYRIDVKAKERSVFVKDNYEVSVPDNQKDFNVDFYYFYSYNKAASIMEFLGWISKKEYFKKARQIKKGDIDRSNNWVSHKDCYNLPISELYR